MLLHLPLYSILYNVWCRDIIDMPWLYNLLQSYAGTPELLHPLRYFVAISQMNTQHQSLTFQSLS